MRSPLRRLAAPITRRPRLLAVLLGAAALPALLPTPALSRTLSRRDQDGAAGARAVARELAPLADEARELPGIDFNVEEQLERLHALRFAHELEGLPHRSADAQALHVDNPFVGAGDLGYWYNLLRARKPRRVIEIGSGFSTLAAERALARNREEDPASRCHHLCIERYPSPTVRRLAAAGSIELLESRAERVDRAVFAPLDEGDILFIDSSHMIRPQGDVLFEYLELLPTLRPGVIVHVHDIFSPRDYPARWLRDAGVFWNEQYLLEGFLTNNREWKIIGALNHLAHEHFERLRAVCPFLTPESEPGSFYLQKIA